MGQKLVEQLYFNILLVFAAIGFCCGYIAQDFDVAFQIACIGILVCLIVRYFDWIIIRPSFRFEPTPLFTPLSVRTRLFSPSLGCSHLDFIHR